MRDVCLLQLPLGIDMTAGASPEAIKRHVRDRLALALCADPNLIERHFAPNEYSLAMLGECLVARFTVPNALQRQLLDVRGRPVRESTLAQDIVDLAHRVDSAVQRGVVLLQRVVDATLSAVPSDAIADIERESGVSTAPLRKHVRIARQAVEIGTHKGSHSLDPAAVRTNYIRDDPVDIRADVLDWPTPRTGLKIRIVEAHPAGPEIRALMARKSVTGHLEANSRLDWRHAATAAYAFGQSIVLRVRVIESTTTCRPQALAVDGIGDLHLWQPEIVKIQGRSMPSAGQAQLWADDPRGPPAQADASSARTQDFLPTESPSPTGEPDPDPSPYPA